MEDIILRIAIGIPGFLIAIVFHEWAHAYVAMKFGDDTAKLSGRLTFNPIAHLDPIGTVIFPLIGAVSGWMMFGWAKPVPVDPRRFTKPRAAIFWVSFAGPGMNMILGIISSLLLAIVVTKFSSDFYFFKPFKEMLLNSVYINFILALFNLFPIPPLDGSKMVSAFLSYEVLAKYESMARYSFIIILLLMVTQVWRYLLMPALLAANVSINAFIYLLT